MRFEKLASGNVIVLEGDAIIRSFPPSAYITASELSDQVIRIDADPAGGNNSKTFEFAYTAVTFPFCENRTELITCLASDYFIPDPSGAMDVNQIMDSVILLLRAIKAELKENNKYLKKITTHHG